MRHWTWVRTAMIGAALLPAAALGACDDGPAGPEPASDRLAESVLRWRSQDVSSYEYVFRAVCFCGPDARQPVRVEVVGGEVASVTSLETGEPAVPPFPGDDLAVEGLFGFLSDALAGDPAAFHAAYDPDLGYPTSVFVDFREEVADEEFGFEARDLTFVELLTAAHAGP